MPYRFNCWLDEPLFLFLRWLVGDGWGWLGWLETLGIKNYHLQVDVEVETIVELGNIFFNIFQYQIL